MKDCPKCHSAAKPEARFCDNCGYDFSKATEATNAESASPANAIPAAPGRKCPRCGTTSGAGAKFCKNCATPLDPGARPLARDRTLTRDRKPLIIGAVLLGVIVGAAIIILIVSSSSPDSPNVVVTKTIRAVENGDTQGFKKLITKNFVENDRKFREDPDKMINEGSRDIKGKGGISTIDIKKTEINGDVAAVDFSLTYGNGKNDSGTMKLIKEDGRWKVNSF